MVDCSNICYTNINDVSKNISTICFLNGLICWCNNKYSKLKIETINFKDSEIITYQIILESKDIVHNLKRNIDF